MLNFKFGEILQRLSCRANIIGYLITGGVGKNFIKIEPKMGDKIYPKNGIYFPPCLYIMHARVSYKWFFKWDFLKNGA